MLASNPSTLRFQTRALDSGARVLQLGGPLTTGTVAEFQNTVSRAAGSPLILDLSQVTGMDSGGLGALVVLAACRHPFPGIGFANMNTHIRRLVDISGLSRVLPCFDSLDEARAALQESDPYKAA